MGTHLKQKLASE